MSQSQNRAHLLYLIPPSTMGEEGRGRPALLCSVTWGPSLGRKQGRGRSKQRRHMGELSETGYGTRLSTYPFLYCARTRITVPANPMERREGGREGGQKETSKGLDGRETNFLCFYLAYVDIQDITSLLQPASYLNPISAPFTDTCVFSQCLGVEKI